MRYEHRFGALVTLVSDSHIFEGVPVDVTVQCEYMSDTRDPGNGRLERVAGSVVCQVSVRSGHTRGQYQELKNLRIGEEWARLMYLHSVNVLGKPYRGQSHVFELVNIPNQWFPDYFYYLPS